MDSERIKLLYIDINNIILKIYKSNSITEYEKFEKLINELKKLFIDTYTIMFTVENNDMPINFIHYEYFNNDITKEHYKFIDELETLKYDKFFKKYVPTKDTLKRLDELYRENIKLKNKIEELENNLNENNQYDINFFNNLIKYYIYIYTLYYTQ